MSPRATAYPRPRWKCALPVSLPHQQIFETVQLKRGLPLILDKLLGLLRSICCGAFDGQAAFSEEGLRRSECFTPSSRSFHEPFGSDRWS